MQIQLQQLTRYIFAVNPHNCTKHTGLHAFLDISISQVEQVKLLKILPVVTSLVATSSYLLQCSTGTAASRSVGSVDTAQLPVHVYGYVWEAEEHIPLPLVLQVYMC